MKRFFIALLFLPALLPATASASVPPPGNPWIMGDRGFMNMAHQGGELEAPSSTIYAFRTALIDRGADILELDVRTTADNRLVVIQAVAGSIPVAHPSRKPHEHGVSALQVRLNQPVFPWLFRH